MKIIRTTVITALILAPLAAGQAQDVGLNSAVRNIVSVKANQAAQAQQAKVRERVRLGNQMKTGKDSGLQMLLIDKSAFSMGPNAGITVDRFVYDPARKVSAVGASIAQGAFRFVSGKPTHGASGQTSLRTPTASIGIRGTMVEGAVGLDAVMIANAMQGLGLPTNIDPATASIVILRGPGPNATRGERRGEISVTSANQTINLNQPGQAVFVPRVGAPPFGPFQLPPNGFAALDNLLRSTPSLAGAPARTSQQQSSVAGQAASSAGLGSQTVLLSLLAAVGVVAAATSGGSNSPG